MPGFCSHPELYKSGTEVSLFAAVIAGHVLQSARNSTYSEMNPDPKVEFYLRDVRARLSSATASEEEEVIRAVDARVQELTSKSGATVESAIEQLGPAAKVAARYRDANLITRASKSNAPLLLLHASLRNGALGGLAALMGIAGYWYGFAVIVFGVLAFTWSGFHYNPHAGPPIGSSMIQTLMSVAFGVIVLVLTTALLRLLLSVSKKKRATL